MYGNRDNDYFREALNDTNSHLYKKICQSGPVVTFRLLTSSSLDLRGGLIVYRVEPSAYDWSKLATTGTSTTFQITSTDKQQERHKNTDNTTTTQSTNQQTEFKPSV